MNQAAQTVLEKFKEIFLSYGQSDEYSFVLSQDTDLFNRREAKILSCVVSTFTAAFVLYWGKHFDIEMKDLPVFDGRCVCYPHLASLKDYFRWRQVDCHINNLYNTVFWCLVKQGKSHTEVEEMLRVTNSGQKNEILFSEFGLNYNNIEEVYRKGTVGCYYSNEGSKQEKESGEKKEVVVAKEENIYEQEGAGNEEEPKAKVDESNLQGPVKEQKPK